MYFCSFHLVELRQNQDRYRWSLIKETLGEDKSLWRQYMSPPKFFAVLKLFLYSYLNSFGFFKHNLWNFGFWTFGYWTVLKKSQVQKSYFLRKISPNFKILLSWWLPFGFVFMHRHCKEDFFKKTWLFFSWVVKILPEEFKKCSWFFFLWTKSGKFWKVHTLIEGLVWPCIKSWWM